jgi:hypothetical protein
MQVEIVIEPPAILVSQQETRNATLIYERSDVNTYDICMV